MRTTCQCSGSSELARNDAANIHLIGGSLGQLEIAVAGHEMPLRSEVVVQTGYAEVALLGDPYIGLVPNGVYRVASGAGDQGAARIIASGHLRAPHLRYRGVDSDAAGIHGLEGCNTLEHQLVDPLKLTVPASKVGDGTARS